MPIKAVFGGVTLAPSFMPDFETAETFMATLKKVGIDTIDTARLYEGSEAYIGRVSNHAEFTIDTKLVGGFGAGTLTKEQIPKDTYDSLERLQIKQVDVLYIHAPDTSVSLPEALEAINELHKQGVFRRLGLSNFSAEQVQEVYDIAKSNGYILPTVYQGNYNPLARKIEALIFPTIRKLGMAFYAYSPLAGGFLTKSIAQIDEGAGRFNDNTLGGLYKQIYNRPAFREALADWNDIAEKEGVSKAELAYRWVGYNSLLKEEYGDAVIFGATKVEQIEQTAAWLKKGGLSEQAVKDIDAVWEKVKDAAPVDNYQVMHHGA